MRARERTRSRPGRRRLGFVLGALAAGSAGSGCLSLTPQLAPAELPRLEQLADRELREAAYEQERIREVYDPRGKRFVKGDDPNAPKRGWQSLDAALRSDANSAAALPERKLRLSRALFGVALASSMVMVGGAAATAREGVDLPRVTGPSGVLLSGAALSLGFGVAAGVTFGQARRGYERAVVVYNESLGMRLGLYDANGAYIPPPGTLLDEEGFIILEDKLSVAPSVAPAEPASAALALRPRDLTAESRRPTVRP